MSKQRHILEFEASVFELSQTETPIVGQPGQYRYRIICEQLSGKPLDDEDWKRIARHFRRQIRKQGGKIKRTSFIRRKRRE